MALSNLLFLIFFTAFIFIVPVTHSQTVAPQPCNFTSSVDLSDGIMQEDGSIIHNGITYNKDQYFTHEDNETETIRGCVCLVRQCTRKCCGIGEAFYGRQCNETDNPVVNPFSPSIYQGTDRITSLVGSDHFGLLFENPCVNGRYLVNPVTDPRYQFYLQQDGLLYQPNEGRYMSRDEYCIDYFLLDPNNVNNINWTPTILALFCFGQDTATAGFALYGLYAIGLILSVPFLLATFAVYAFIPELRNVHGRSLMCYVAALALAYILLASLQLQPYNVATPMEGCLAIAFIAYFSFMASFFWLNVMCIDIWWTFRYPMASYAGSQKKRSGYGGMRVSGGPGWRRFLIYSAYAWGGAFMLTGLVVFMQFYHDLPVSVIRPNFGVNRCWFQAESRSEMVYFYTPMLILVACNVILFVTTATKILKIRRETSILKNSESARHDQYKKDKQRFILYLKLFIVMGVNWTAELISFFVGGNYYFWIVTDITNLMLGVCIFIIFVCKRKVKNLLIKRFNSLCYGSTERGGTSSRSRWAYRSSETPTEDTRLTTASDENSMRLREVTPAAARI